MSAAKKLVRVLSIIPRSGPRFAEENDAKSRKSKQAFVGRPTNACLATRNADGAELAFVTEDGQTVKVLASEDQIDRLVDELEDILNAPPGDES